MKEIKPLDKELYLFELDNVLFPKRDYMVQVFYLFGSFYEFTVGSYKANDIAQFMSKIYDIHGEEQVFSTTKIMFNIDDQYEENYNRLIANAQLLLKLEFTPQIKSILSELKSLNKKIAILTKGNPVEQLNKVKFLDWGLLDSLKESLKIYFIDELAFQSIQPLEFIAQEYEIPVEQIAYIDSI